MSDFYTNGSCTDSSVVFYMNPWYYLVYIFLRRLESCRSVCVMCLFFLFFCVCVCGEAKRAVLLAPPSPSPPLELKEKVSDDGGNLRTIRHSVRVRGRLCCTLNIQYVIPIYCVGCRQGQAPEYTHVVFMLFHLKT